MAESRQRDEWSRCSLMLAVMCNLQRQSRTDKVWKPNDFNPFAPPPREKTFDEMFPPNLIDVSKYR